MPQFDAFSPSQEDYDHDHRALLDEIARLKTVFASLTAKRTTAPVVTAAPTAAVSGSAGGGSSSGITSVSLAVPGGFTSASPSPGALTITTALSGLLKGDGANNIGSAVPTTDYTIGAELPPCLAVATANVASLSGLQNFDGVTFSDGMAVLLSAQTSASQNGPWIQHASAWTRPAGYSTGQSIGPAAFLVVARGTAFANTIWQMTGAAAAITVGTTATAWTQFSSAFTGTAGSVPFVGGGGSLAQDNANLFWDAPNKRFGIGTNAPATPLHVIGEPLFDALPAATNAGIALRNTNTAAGRRFWRIESDSTVGPNPDALYVRAENDAGNAVIATPLILYRDGSVQVGTAYKSSDGSPGYNGVVVGGSDIKSGIVTGPSSNSSNASVPGGNTIANTASNTAFATTWPIPNVNLKVGSTYRLKLFGVYSTAGSAPTLTVTIKFATDGAVYTLIASPTFTTIAGISNGGWSAECEFTVFNASTTGTIEAQGGMRFYTSSTATQEVPLVNTTTVTGIDIADDDPGVGFTVSAFVQWGTASVSNTITLRLGSLEQIA